MTRIKSVTLECLENAALASYPHHPFEDLNQKHCRSMLTNFLGMSEAFPYLLAGSQKDLILNFIRSNTAVPDHVATTSVVANFLSWDETGGFYLMRTSGTEKLPDIVDRTYSHVKLLRHDVTALLGQGLQPHYGAPTGPYLCWLADGLASTDPLQRCAFMVSFEVHAGRMLTNLWQALQRIFGENAADLRYFYAHVGGRDPAETLHARMVNKMLLSVVEEKDTHTFLDAFLSIYAAHLAWCGSISTGRMS